MVGLNTRRGPEFRSHRLRHAGQHCASGCDSWVIRPVALGRASRSTTPALGFAADAAAVEITLANGRLGPCGPVDDFGRCSARSHDLQCAHGQGVDWLASGPHPATGEASLANLADSLALDLAPRSVWGDPDDDDEPGYEVPQRTVELAAALNDDWFGDVLLTGADGSADERGRRVVRGHGLRQPGHRAPVLPRHRGDPAADGDL